VAGVKIPLLDFGRDHLQGVNTANRRPVSKVMEVGFAPIAVVTGGSRRRQKLAVAVEKAGCRVAREIARFYFARDTWCRKASQWPNASSGQVFACAYRSLRIDNAEHSSVGNKFWTLS
jgi:hypothetical protein